MERYVIVLTREARKKRDRKEDRYPPVSSSKATRIGNLIGYMEKPGKPRTTRRNVTTPKLSFSYSSRYRHSGPK